MRFRSVLSVLLVPAVLGLCALISGCSKSSNKATNPVTVVEPFESGDLGTTVPTNTFVHTFGTAGSFGFRCRHHGPTMTGTVTVVGGGADSVIWPMGPGNVFGTPNPGSSVKLGGYVRWVNTSGIHTVTRP